MPVAPLPFNNHGLTLAILVAGFLIAYYLHTQLRDKLCPSIAKKSHVFSERDLAALTRIVAYFIGFSGLSLALSRVQIPSEIAILRFEAIKVGYLVIALRLVFGLISPFLTLLGEQRLQYLHATTDAELKRTQQRIHFRITLIRYLLFTLLCTLPALLILEHLGVNRPLYFYLTALLFLIALSLSTPFLTTPILNKQQAKRFAQGSGEKEEGKEEVDAEQIQRDTILTLFLSIFKSQLHVSEHAPAHYAKIGEPGFSGHIYELRVQTKREWSKRRLSIKRLGETAASRSVCFCVTFDNHIVVKITPRPVETLSEYAAILRRENNLASQLNMSGCIVPTVSVILKHLRHLTNKNQQVNLETEGDYLTLLLISTDLQQYLKIADHFAFFMDLSEYYFLQDPIDKIYQLDQVIRQEITGHAAIAWNLLTFKQVYGKTIVPYIKGLNHCFNQFETAALRLTAAAATPISVSKQQLKHFFFSHLAGTPLDVHSPDAQLHLLLKPVVTKALSQEQETVHGYRQLVSQFCHNIQFKSNKAIMEAISTNLMQLLGHLRQVGVAMRDLKPDNMLIAGDRNDYPAFLTDYRKYKIGLIDIETAVSVKPSDSKGISQPQLGGTPHYCTPSHFFNNEIIENTFGDLAHTLYLQDLHATAGIIYKIITGKLLFHDTIRNTPSFAKAIGHMLQQGQSSRTIVRELSCQFWEHAGLELERKLTADQVRLESCQIVLPTLSRQTLRNYLKKDISTIKQQLKYLLKKQTCFPDPTHQHHLLHCPAKQLEQPLSQLHKKLNPDSKKPLSAKKEEQYYDKINLLNRLKTLKEAGENDMRALTQLREKEASLTANKLIALLFGIVKRHMYKIEWQTSAATLPTVPLDIVIEGDQTVGTDTATITNSLT